PRGPRRSGRGAGLLQAGRRGRQADCRLRQGGHPADVRSTAGESGDEAPAGVDVEGESREIMREKGLRVTGRIRTRLERTAFSLPAPWGAATVVPPRARCARAS